MFGKRGVIQTDATKRNTETSFRDPGAMSSLLTTGRVMYSNCVKPGISRSHLQAPCEAVRKKISGQTDGTGQPSG
jgi:hypothetical protein